MTIVLSISAFIIGALISTIITYKVMMNKFQQFLQGRPAPKRTRRVIAGFSPVVGIQTKEMPVGMVLPIKGFNK